MATFDQLSAEQRAIIELVLQQGRSYGELADMLGFPEPRVRDLARDALVTLSPLTADTVDEDWQGQLADYLLGQQTGPEATATRGHLRRSESARTWARSLMDSLDQFYENGNFPQVPEGEAGRERVPRRRERERERPRARKEPASARGKRDEDDDDRDLSPEARAVVRRRRLLAAGAAALALILVAVLLWPIGVLTGDDDKDDKASSARRGQASIVGQLLLRPVGGGKGQGLAVIARRGKEQQLVVQARLPANKNRQAYEVWLYNSAKDARSLGAQVTDQQGTYQGAGPLPADYKRYKYIDISLEKVDQDASHSGQSVLRGEIAAIQKPDANAQGGGGTPQAPQQQPQPQP